uniref:Hyp20 n=1 Tax=Moniliophthora roreri (strain MCA 2997) TaxID=1381753 RepID=F2WVL1_MONRO|nr:hyp20 [Moniliophthora roreri]ADO51603.1 hyp20 [Moniliophthora roreri]
MKSWKKIQDFMLVTGFVITVDQFFDKLSLRHKQIIQQIEERSQEVTENRISQNIIQSCKTLKSGYETRTGLIQENINELTVKKNKYAEIINNPTNFDKDTVNNAEIFFKKYTQEIQECKAKLNMESKNVLEQILDIIDSNNKNKFIENISNLKKVFSEYLSTLELDQLCAISNLLIGLLITSLIINIILIFFGDFLIKYFSLEQKFPKLAIFINIRRKIINISMFYNTMFILFLSIMAIIINASYLFY